MNNKQLIAEVRRLNRILKVATRKAAGQMVLIDKLTAVNLHVQRLLRKLETDFLKVRETE
jgi:hypothetical protein